MLEKQSLDEFLSNINKGKAVIVSVSPQSRAAFAVHFGLSPLQVNRIFAICFPILICTTTTTKVYLTEDRVIYDMDNMFASNTFVFHPVILRFSGNSRHFSSP